jgi:hypothetical protein
MTHDNNRGRDVNRQDDLEERVRGRNPKPGNIFFRVTLVSNDELKVDCAGEPSPYDGLALKREE